jgi:hypothetical protein
LPCLAGLSKNIKKISYKKKQFEILSVQVPAVSLAAKQDDDIGSKFSLRERFAKDASMLTVWPKTPTGD